MLSFFNPKKRLRVSLDPSNTTAVENVNKNNVEDNEMDMTASTAITQTGTLMNENVNGGRVNDKVNGSKDKEMSPVKDVNGSCDIG